MHRFAFPMVLVAVLMTGCVARPEPAPAVLSTDVVPSEAPRDAVSHIRAAGLPEQPLNTDSDPYIVEIEVVLDDAPVPIPAHLGVDRLRAVQAPVHTHDDSGDVWLEGEGNRDVTLGQFFTLWGVSFDGDCLASYCTALGVLADGEPVDSPVDLVLRGHDAIVVTARS